MTTTPLKSSASTSSDVDLVRTRTSRARAGIIMVMIVAILAAAITRDWAMRQRLSVAAVPGTASGSSRSSLGSMNSFSLALLLGGLRGPLVMFLWSTSESQKADKNLEDFDTKVEWIRLLQPEFDTVHIFQVWNKAYNISVQMASLANKYTTILDALEYAKDVLRGRPDNINLTASVAQVYSDKLGNSAEKQYYTRRMRAETAEHQRKQRLDRSDPAWRPVEHDTLLDAQGNLLSAYITPTRQPRAGHTGLFNDGAELQYLKQYQPFPYGVPPMALAYNYYKQAQVLQRESKQKHAQLSDTVIDSRPGLTLKQWAESEGERGRRNELMAYGLPVPTERIEMEAPSIVLPANATPDAARIAEALDAYAVSARVAGDSITEYEDHLRLYPTGETTYESHIDGLIALREMSLADEAYLAAQSKTGQEKADLLAVAATHYRNAADQNYRILLRYYADDQMTAKHYPAGLTRERTKEIPAPELRRVYQQIMNEVKSAPFDPYAEDRAEYEAYINRAEQRLQSIGG
ncbi:MAG TPA: hypothetical protein VGN72_14305 [Tepidisphaeraceae bacterium]|jgi:hypothetical protein|nr:hypothetical protein [Tepidisphaeraceae bacterium]